MNVCMTEVRSRKANISRLFVCDEGVAKTERNWAREVLTCSVGARSLGD